jgi:hypothetical protein
MNLDEAVVSFLDAGESDEAEVNHPRIFSFLIHVRPTKTFQTNGVTCAHYRSAFTLGSQINKVQLHFDTFMGGGHDSSEAPRSFREERHYFSLFHLLRWRRAEVVDDRPLIL